MPYQIELRDDLIYCSSSGRMSTAELVAGLREIAQLEATLATTPDRISDLSAVTNIDLGFAEMDHAALVRRMAVLKNPIRSAIIAPTDLQFGMARMFQSLNNNPKIMIAIFRDAASAWQWIRSPKTESTP